jgi:undecaprenyl diphosphate synthase
MSTPASSSDSAAAPSPDWSHDPVALAALERIRRVNPEADPVGRLPDVHPARIPRHIAVIMDGNGRWAQQRGFARILGHRTGAAAVRTLIEETSAIGVEVLTLYSFSMENWKRPDDEVSALMYLYELYLEGERERLVRKNIRFRQIGRREGLPAEVVAAVDRLEAATRNNTGPMLCIAVNYGSRAEIVDATKALAGRVAAGELRVADIDEQAVSGALYTAGIPDPDLLIRTAGEMRLSNYLLWQLSYTELFVTETLWPDFGIADIHRSIRSFAARDRRFGRVSSG